MTIAKKVEINLSSGNLLDLVSDIEGCAEITLTRDGVPFAKVLPILSEQLEKPKAGLNRGAMVMKGDFDEPLPDSFWGI